MGVIESVKKGFSIAKSSSNLVLVLFVFSFLWNITNILAAPGEDAVAASVPVSMVGLGIIFVLASVFMQAGSLGFVVEVIKKGSSSMAAFTASGKKNYLRILGVGFIVALYVLVLTVVAVFVVFIGGGEQPNPIALVVGGVIGILGLVGVVLLFFAPYIVVAEDQSAIAAIKKSVAVVKANIMNIILIGLVLLVIGFAIGFFLGLLMGLLTGALAGIPGQIAAGFLSSLVNAVLGVVTTGAFMAYYLSLTEPGPEETETP